jgi:hypothetical protein
MYVLVCKCYLKILEGHREQCLSPVSAVQTLYAFRKPPLHGYQCSRTYTAEVMPFQGIASSITHLGRQPTFTRDATPSQSFGPDCLSTCITHPTMLRFFRNSCACLLLLSPSQSCHAVHANHEKALHDEQRSGKWIIYDATHLRLMRSQMHPSSDQLESFRRCMAYPTARIAAPPIHRA